MRPREQAAGIHPPERVHSARHPFKSSPFSTRLRLAAWLVGSSLLPLPAQAGTSSTVAVINLTGRRVDPVAVEAFSKNLREAMLLDPAFTTVDELEMYKRLSGSEGKNKLKEARVLLSEGKKQYREAHFAPALKLLEQARATHRELYSELSRADELADLLLYQGLAQHRLLMLEAAQLSFLQMYLIAPELDVEQAPDLDEGARTLLEAARRQERAMPLRGMNPTFAAEVARKLQVAHLVTGVIDSVGRSPQEGATITLQVVAPGRPQPEATLVFDLETLAQGAPPLNDPIYQRILGVSSRYLSRK